MGAMPCELLAVGSVTPSHSPARGAKPRGAVYLIPILGTEGIRQSSPPLELLYQRGGTVYSPVRDCGAVGVARGYGDSL